MVYAARAVHAGDKAAGHDARGIVRHAALRGIFRISVLDGVACRLARHGEYSGCCGGNSGRRRGRGRLDVDCGIFRHDDRICRGRFGGKIRHENAPGAIGYVQKAFGRHGAKIYAAGCVLSALGMGTMAQTGAASSVLVPMGVPRVLAGVVFAGLLLFCVRGGLPKAVRVTEKLVPFMAGLFLALCAAVLLLRGSHIPGAVRNMLKGAFSLKAGAGGVCGMILAMREGISRGVFTNEAGLGSGTFATFRTENKTPEQIGTLGALQVFIDTILLCTITALCMLVSPVRDFSPEAALSVFSLVLGQFGELSAGVCVALFAFASVLAWSCYGMDALLYLLPKKGAAEKRIYMAFTAFSCFLGCMSPFLGVLNVCDAFNGLMALLNVPALLVLTPQVFAKQIAQKPKKV